MKLSPLGALLAMFGHHDPHTDHVTPSDHALPAPHLPHHDLHTGDDWMGSDPGIPATQHDGSSIPLDKFGLFFDDAPRLADMFGMAGDVHADESGGGDGGSSGGGDGGTSGGGDGGASGGGGDGPSGGTTGGGQPPGGIGPTAPNGGPTND